MIRRKRKKGEGQRCIASWTALRPWVYQTTSSFESTSAGTKGLILFLQGEKYIFRLGAFFANGGGAANSRSVSLCVAKLRFVHTASERRAILPSLPPSVSFFCLVCHCETRERNGEGGRDGGSRRKKRRYEGNRRREKSNSLRTTKGRHAQKK